MPRKSKTKKVKEDKKKPIKSRKQKQKQKQSVNVNVHIDQSKRTHARQKQAEPVRHYAGPSIVMNTPSYPSQSQPDFAQLFQAFQGVGERSGNRLAQDNAPPPAGLVQPAPLPAQFIPPAPMQPIQSRPLRPLQPHPNIIPPMFNKPQDTPLFHVAQLNLGAEEDEAKPPPAQTVVHKKATSEDEGEDGDNEGDGQRQTGHRGRAKGAKKVTDDDYQKNVNKYKQLSEADLEDAMKSDKIVRLARKLRIAVHVGNESVSRADMRAAVRGLLLNVAKDDAKYK